MEQRRIAVATLDDVPSMLGIDVWLTSRSRQELLLREAIASGKCLIARGDRSDAAGFITWNRHFFNRPFVWLLVVAPTHRRQGIGRSLLSAVEATCGDDIFVSTERINEPMQMLLGQMGYERSGELEFINPRGNPEIFYYKRLNGRIETLAFPVDR